MSKSSPRLEIQNLDLPKQIIVHISHNYISWLGQKSEVREWQLLFLVFRFNCFVYIAFAKNLWKIKFGESKIDQKYFAKLIKKSRKLLLLRSFCRLYLRCCVSCVPKILLPSWEIWMWFLHFIFPFIKTKNKNQNNFQQFGGLVTRNMV